LDVLLLDGMATSNSRGKLCDKDWCVLSGALGNGRNEERETQVRLAKLSFLEQIRMVRSRSAESQGGKYPGEIFGTPMATGWLLAGCCLASPGVTAVWFHDAQCATHNAHGAACGLPLRLAVNCRAQTTNKD
jgi:hypothetical protein